MKKFEWSFSSLELFDYDRQAWKRRYIDGVKDDPSPALERGRQVHEELEGYMLDRNEINPAWERFARVIKQSTHGKEFYVEKKMGVTRELQPCRYFCDEVWGRCAADVLILNEPKGLILDWKSGRKDDRGGRQLEMIAWFSFLTFPQIEKFEGFNIYVDKGLRGDVFTFDRKKFLEYSTKILKRIAVVEKYYNEQTERTYAPQERL